jgi:putative transposase
LLAQALPGFSLPDLCQSWKLWTARRINQKLGLKGHLWQGESWDHLLRRPEYLRKFRNYLRLNPVMAKLPPEDYSLWLPDIAGIGEVPG